MNSIAATGGWGTDSWIFGNSLFAPSGGMESIPEHLWNFRLRALKTKGEWSS
jgi:hypothetical protein